jgi:hypothetical protein
VSESAAAAQRRDELCGVCEFVQQGALNTGQNHIVLKNKVEKVGCQLRNQDSCVPRNLVHLAV